MEVNGGLNGHSNGHSNGHTNGYSNGHLKIHSNGQTNGHTNADLPEVGKELNGVTGKLADIDLRKKSVSILTPEESVAQFTDAKKDRRKDEYEVDFSDTRPFAVSRWKDILSSAEARLTTEDLELGSQCKTWQAFHHEIQSKWQAPGATQFMKRHLGKIQSFPQTLAALTKTFSKLVEPLDVEFSLLWSLLFINIRFSYEDQDTLKRNSDLMIKIRRVLENFNRSLEYCDQGNEASIAVVEFLDPLVIILVDSIDYFREYPPGTDSDQGWPDLNETIRQQLFNLETTVKHVNDISQYSKINQERKAKNLSIRHALIPENEETGTFPVKRLPFTINKRFYGRKNELAKIVKYLSPRDDGSLRTYTIYGRRGIGKTEIALQFAHHNPSGYDAVFWIQCETSVSIRESFTTIAKALKLPGADGNPPHEENLLKVHAWLKKTRKKWLLIFDNAEKDAILRPYWPVGASGAILITSRQYFNFPLDVERKGETIKPFNAAESWDLLLQLLGDDWQKDDREGRIPHTEITAAKAMLEKLEGLALAIRQAARLIKDPEIGGPTIAMTLEMFKKRIEDLQVAHIYSNSSSIKSLNALWDMTFRSLSNSARALLGVLAWFSPDVIPTQLFLPVEQDALDPMLSVFRQEAKHIDKHNRASIVNLEATPALQSALNELVRLGLIKNDGLNYSIHRVVQEAVNYRDNDELQLSFDTASRLVYERFPKTTRDSQLFGEWSRCQEYIAHGVYLGKKYLELMRMGRLKGSKYLVRLLNNCAQYLYESGDFDATEKILESAMVACDDKHSLLFANLRNVAGSRFFDLNRLADCRRAWTEALKIRKSHLSPDDIAVASIYHNLANLELADGETKASLDYLERARVIYLKWGDLAAEKLALTFLCIGRAEMLKGLLDDALASTKKSEALFRSTSGSDKGFMVNVHYAYGNIHYRKQQYSLAARSYEDCLKLCQFTMPIHPIIIAIWYSLSCVAFDQGNADVAKGHLDRAKEIAELRSPRYDDGPIARINWKTAIVLESSQYGVFKQAAKELREKAMAAYTNLTQSGEGGNIPIPDDEDADEYDETEQEEDMFDALVPLFYR